MMPEIVWNGFALVGIVFCVGCLLIFFIQLPRSLKDNAAAKLESEHRSLMKKVAEAGEKSLEIAVKILAKAGLSYNIDAECRSLRWKIPKAIWSSERYAVEKAKALNTVMVAGRHYAGDSTPELDLCQILKRRAKRNPMAVIAISCALTRFNQNFKRWLQCD